MPKPNENNYQFLNDAKRTALNHREGIYNAALTIAGGALVLSITFANQFSFSIGTVFVLKIAWLLLMLSIISNILMRYFFNVTTITSIHMAHFEMESLINPETVNFKVENPVKKLFQKWDPSNKTSVAYKIASWIFWASFIGGLAFLLYFAWVNI